MYVRQWLSGDNVRRLAAVSVLISGGCGAVPGTEDARGSHSTLNLSVLGIGSESTYYETNPNHQLELAEFVEITDEPRVIRGRISGANDVDVYDLGPVTHGERILVTMTPDDSLDGAIALFDDTGTALLVNDHRNVYLGKAEPFVDIVILHASLSCFVAVSATPGYNSSGDYGLVASKEYPVDVPDLRPDVVLLVFDGGSNVRIGTRPPVNVPVFDAADISPVYAGQTEVMIDRIVEGVREDYRGIDVTIISTSEGFTYEPGMTRVFFGTFDEALLGVAENVDEFNATSSQQAIVFCDTFEAFMRLDPSVSQMAQAIANVTSHEAGHLLGMIHTHDPGSIMDVTASLSELLGDQAFIRAPIYSAVFPLGYQDAVQYLFDTMGGDAGVWFFKELPTRRRISQPQDDDHVPARAELCLSSCCLHEH